MSTVKLTKQQEKQYIRARVGLMQALPFVASISLSAQTYFCTSWEGHPIDTAATDGLREFINPNFFFTELAIIAKDMGVRLVDLQMFVLAHESMHRVLDHIVRCKEMGYKMRRWNIAGDYVINQYLEEMGMKVPSLALRDKKYDSYSADQIYRSLPDEPEYGHGKGGQPGLTGDDILPMPDDGSPAAASEITQEIQHQIAQALENMKAAGQGMDSLPSGLRRFIDEFMNPKKSWRDELREYFTDSLPDGYDWNRRNKRYQEVEAFLPRRKDRGVLGEVLFVVDNSGSVRDELIDAMVGEINGIRDEIPIRRLHLVYADTRVHEGGEFFPGDPLVVNVPDGGGTDFRAAVALAEREAVDLCIYMTDLAGAFPEQEPSVPVVWAGYGSYAKKNPAPFGTTIIVEED